MAVERKLKYCPVCGEGILINYDHGIIYKAIRWTCRDTECVMAAEWYLLHKWNHAYLPRSERKLPVGVLSC